MTEKLSLREIDALIAEKVTGLEPCDKWRRVNFGSAGGPAMIKDRGDCAHADGKCYPPKANYGDGNGCPRYTADPAASKMVREKLAERFHSIRLCRSGSTFSLSVATFNDWPRSTHLGDEAATEELAVALCSLKAYGLDVEVAE